MAVQVQYADRVKETSTTTGTGNFTTAGAATGFQTFNTAFGTNVYFYYVIQLQSGAEWEVGRGYLSGATTLVRAAADVLASSAGVGTLVSFSAGTKDVFCSMPAYDVQRDAVKGRVVAQALGYAMP